MPTQARQTRKSNVRILALTVVVVVAVTVVGVFRGSRSSRSSTESHLSDSGLVVAPDTLNFGEVWEDSKFTWGLPILNPSQYDAQVEEFRTSCTCSSAEPRSLTIPAGETRVLKLTLDLTAARSKVPDAEWRAFQVTIWPRLQDGFRKGWTLTGRVHTAIRIDQPVLDFGRRSYAAQPLAAQNAVVTSFVPLRQLIVRSNSPELNVTVHRSSVFCNRFDIVLTPRKLKMGAMEYELSLIPCLSDTQQLPPKSLRVTGRIINDFQASPPDALFGARAIGDVVEETFTVYSLTNQPFQITSVTIAGDAISVERASTDISGTALFRLRQRVTKSGECRGNIVFHIKGKGGEENQLPVEVSYLGIGASD
jgi:hypothetical protein